MQAVLLPTVSVLTNAAVGVTNSIGKEGYESTTNHYASDQTSALELDCVEPRAYMLCLKVRGFSSSTYMTWSCQPQGQLLPDLLGLLFVSTLEISEACQASMT